MDAAGAAKSKAAAAAVVSLWVEGFGEACCLHRVFLLCLRSRPLLLRTGQCFLFNGFIFLGSLFVLNSVVIPALWWLLPDHLSHLAPTPVFYPLLRLLLVQFFYLFWFYPLYVFSIVLSTIWYNDIAKFGYAAMGRSKFTGEKDATENNSSTSQSASHVKRPAGLGGVMIGIGEQVYSILLLSVFFLEVYATGFIPYIGKVLNFVLLSWMYAYYCFEYKWNFNEVPLDKRLDYFQSYWPFFAGFVCVNCMQLRQELQKQGWKPRRTIILCNWDAEEYGLDLQNEYVEENKELTSRVVAYLNADSAIGGAGFNGMATPQFDELIKKKQLSRSQAQITHHRASMKLGLVLAPLL